MTYMCTTVITQEGKWFVAHCVELGVVSQGKNVEEAQRNLKGSRRVVRNELTNCLRRGSFLFGCRLL